ncbi:hypothetical protein F5882DRAFT_14929 [Hyaloscypha sp. PMI_1271]|nr:hypothetical protein F5882DRAFT_14929 [Hyaloscypha sp. PMI_1271]
MSSQADVSTMNRSIHEVTTVALSPTSSGRLLIIPCDGTWADRCSSSKGSVVQELMYLIADQEGQRKVIFYLDGLGTRSSWLGKILRGLGLARNVISAYSNLVDNYHEGDKIVLIGYSRGSYTARALAGLLARIGIPRNVNQKSLKKLYKMYFKQELKQPGVAERVMNEYNCHRNVQIEALCCFDTVGALGIPLFGPARILQIFRSKHQFHDTDVTPEVKVNLHACATNEIREPFELTPMHLPNGSINKLHQVWFPGTHGDIGWETKTGLSEAPLAWMIQQLHTLVGIQFDACALQARFPAYGAQAGKIAAPAWLKSQTHKPSRAVLPFITGRKARVPGAYDRPGMTTNERIHISARLRSGSLPLEKAVPGYRVHLDSDGTYYWIRKPTSGFWKLGSTPALPSATQTRIYEATLGDLEAALLGLTCK